MSKRYESDFLRLCDGVFLDAVTLDNSLRKGLDRDYRRLESLYLKNGDHVFTMWLPAIDKVLCKALDVACLPRVAIPLMGTTTKRTNIPRLFQGIWRHVFSDDGCLKQDIDSTWVLILRQLLMAGAKVRMEAPASSLHRTVDAFYKTESQIPKSSPFWAGDGNLLDGDICGSTLDRYTRSGVFDDLFTEATDSSYLLGICQQVADRVAASFGEYIPTENAFRHGRGATADLTRGSGNKYHFRRWSPRLEHIFPYDEVGTSNPALLADISRYQPVPLLEEEASKLIAVPKTQKAPRLIAKEPTCHQWCQQNMLDFFVDRMSRDRSSRYPTYGLSIDFSKQSHSGKDALESSLNGLRTTIDLSEASDRLSTWLIQRLWRKNISLLNAMIACRTRYVRNDIDKKHPTLIELRKFATMGSALTFPLQSLAFFVLAISAGLSTQHKMTNGRQGKIFHWKRLCGHVRIYGDDIIVPTEWLPELRTLLSLVGLKVNEDKTFGGKYFRESCGVDAFKGDDVTPVKIKTFYRRAKPGTVISVVDTANLLYKKGLWWTADTLRKSVPSGNIPVVYARSGVWGDASYMGFSFNHLRSKMDRDLHVRKYSMSQPSAVTKRQQRSEVAANLLQFFTEDPSSTWNRRASKDALPGELGPRKSAADYFASLKSEWQSGLAAVDEAGLRQRWVDPSGWAGYTRYLLWGSGAE
jgi:hypothetical protein